MSKTEINRLPRPLGLTGLMVEYHKQNPEDQVAYFEKIKNLLIHQWIISNGSLCGRSMSQNHLAMFIGCDISDIHEHMKNRLLNNRIWDREVQEQLLNALMGQQIAWAMEDRMDIQAQVDILKASQGNEYKAFISSEVNKALKLKQDSTNAIQAIIKSATGNGNTNIFVPIQNNFNEGQQQGITPHEAIDIIHKELEALNSASIESNVKYLESKYDFTDTEQYPEVVASSQVGSGDKEGLKLLKKEHTMVVDNYKLHRSEEAELDHHEFRREIEEGIELDEEDPELYEYPDVEDE